MTYFSVVTNATDTFATSILSFTSIRAFFLLPFPEFLEELHGRIEAENLNCQKHEGCIYTPPSANYTHSQDLVLQCSKLEKYCAFIIMHTHIHTYTVCTMLYTYLHTHTYTHTQTYALSTCCMGALYCYQHKLHAHLFPTSFYSVSLQVFSLQSVFQLVLL